MKGMSPVHCTAFIELNHICFMAINYMPKMKQNYNRG